MMWMTNRSGDWVRQSRPRTPNHPRIIASSRPMHLATSAIVSSWVLTFGYALADGVHVGDDAEVPCLQGVRGMGGARLERAASCL
jgi:hypothetical protein